MTTRILHLTLHRKWFDAIATGEQVEEYRQMKKYWLRRLVHRTEIKAIEFDEVHFRNGYAKNAPWMRVEWKGMIGKILGGMDDKRFNPAVYVIQLGRVLEIKNWKPQATRTSRTSRRRVA